MPREPYAKIWKKAERRWGGDVGGRATNPLPSRKLFEWVKFERDFGKYLARSLDKESENTFRKYVRSFGKREEEDPSWEGLEFEVWGMSQCPKNIMHYLWVLFLRVRVNCSCGSIHFETVQRVCYIIYGDRSKFLRVNSTTREAWYYEIVTRAPSSTLATCALCRSLIYARSSTCMGHLSQFVRLYWRYILLRYFRAMLNTKRGVASRAQG